MNQNLLLLYTNIMTHGYSKTGGTSVTYSYSIPTHLCNTYFWSIILVSYTYFWQMPLILNFFFFCGDPQPQSMAAKKIGEMDSLSILTNYLPQSFLRSCNLVLKIIVQKWYTLICNNRVREHIGLELG